MNHYNHILEDTIFPSFIVSCVPNINLELLENEAYEFQRQYEGKEYSNNGGYHSPVINENTKFELLDHLKKITLEFAQDFINSKKLDVAINRNHCEWWLNVNKAHHYNVLHTHGRSDLIAIYYIKIPQDSGQLVLLRNDGSQYSKLYSKKSSERTLTLNANVGRLYLLPGHLWHYVTSGENQENRISVSYNINIE